MNTSLRMLLWARLGAVIGLMGIAGACGLVKRADAAAPWRVGQVSARSFASMFAAEPGAGDSLRPAERTFLLRATETGWQLRRLAELGVGNAQSSDVRSHAQQLAVDYGRVTDALEALIRQRGGIAGAPVGGTSETYQRLLENSREGFDREFVRAATRLSHDALTLFEQAASAAKDIAVREFAAAQLPVLRAHRHAAIELNKAFN